MTEQPPEEPTEPTTEPETQQQVQVQTPLSAADHETYAQALYGQPAFVVHSVFSSGKLDPNGTMYTQAQVQAAIDEMMKEPDKTFVEAEQ